MSRQPRRIVDREPETAALKRMLEFTNPGRSRLLVISADGGHGKSSVLRRLHADCVKGRPEIPACLVDLGNLPETFLLVREARTRLRTVVSFARFDAVNQARIGQNFATLLSVLAKGIVDARDAMIDRSVIAGVVYQVVQGNVTIKGDQYVSGVTWTNDMEEFAQERCVEAFFSDLREHCGAAPLVLLLDSYDRADERMQTWIDLELLRRYAFDVDNRPDHLVIVLAGRPEALPDLIAEETDGLVEIRMLERFGELALVRDFFAVNGRSAAEDEDSEYARAKLQAGKWSPLEALNMMDLVFRENRAVDE
jgi:hypothetical protein